MVMLLNILLQIRNKNENLNMIKSDHISPAFHKISNFDRKKRYGHSGGVIWLTGLSGAGKTTLAMLLEERLLISGYACFVLDGDNVRSGLNSDLGFTVKDRNENIRRIGEVAALFAQAGLICIVAFISPYLSDRARARNSASSSSFHEVFIKADLTTCEARDPKGLYKKARTGIIQNFTGLTAPYEVPDNPELIIDTTQQSVDQSLDILIKYVMTVFPLIKEN